MIKNIKNMKLRHKLTVIIMLTSTISLLLTGAIFVMWEYTSFRKNMVRHLLIQAEMVADNCKASVTFDDPKDAEETLNTLRLEPSIVYACIHDTSGRDFAVYYREGTDSSIFDEHVLEDGHIFEDGYLNVFKSIVVDNETIGSVCLRSDLQALYAALTRDTCMVVSVLLCAFLLAYLLSVKLQGLISKPILNLAGAAEKIGKGNLNYKVQVNSNDELGQLACSFNKMTEDLRQTTTSIDNLNQEIAERKQAEEKLRKTHGQLVEASRRAGMAEVATDVLHNVGNILNSINVTSILIREKVSNLRVAKLKKVSDMLNEHADDLGTYLTGDSKGKHIPVYLTEIAAFLNDEQVDIIDKFESLTENVNHIKEIVAVQQSYAKVSGIEVSTSLEELIENAIQINIAGLERHGARLERELAELGTVEIDKQRVLQILVNLINNAKYAVGSSDREDKVLTIRAYKHSEYRLRIEVADNGIGIAEENLTRIFEHGFTTKQNGHGFGLHSGALTAKEMGGSLTVHSNGQGQGATFILELPYKPVEIMT